MNSKTHGHHHTSHNGNSSPVEQRAGQPDLAKNKVNDEEHTKMIEVRAYRLWEQAGKPDGVSAREHFWCEAEKFVVKSHVGGH